MAKDNNSKCNFNHSVNVILFFMFFIVLLAVSLNGCFNITYNERQKTQTEQVVDEPLADETTAQQDSLATNQ